MNLASSKFKHLFQAFSKKLFKNEIYVHQIAVGGGHQPWGIAVAGFPPATFAVIRYSENVFKQLLKSHTFLSIQFLFFSYMKDERKPLKKHFNRKIQ
jgi:hypothetical protein